MGVRTVYDWGEGKDMLYKGERPTGLVVSCADNNVRNKFVYSTLERVFSAICTTSGTCSEKRIRDALKASKVICVGLTPKDSCDQAKRQKIVAMLRKAGVQEVYGVFLQVRNSPFSETQAAIAALEANRPIAEEFDGLVILDHDL